MASRDKVNYKKIFKDNINYYSKSLRKDGLYVLLDNYKIISAIIDSENETPCVSEIVFNEYCDYISLLGEAVNGTKLNQVLGGTGCEFDLDFDNCNLSITSMVMTTFEEIDKFNRVTKYKDKAKVTWQTDSDLIPVDAISSIKKQYNKYKNILSKLEISKTIDFEFENLDKKFIVDVGNEFDLKTILITNKMLPELNKNVKNIKLSVTEPCKLDELEISDVDDIDLRFLIIEVVTDICILYHYYAFTD